MSDTLMRHSVFGFRQLISYQSFLAWLAFRPGLEALLIIGKRVDDPAEKIGDGERQRANSLAERNPIAKKMMAELGLWQFANA